jgi:MYXO-CTERM domain-containing protein
MISVRGGTRAWTALTVVACFGLRTTAARANGRFPGADQLVVDPNEPTHLLVRTTFGFIETRDGGGSWRWICEAAVGQIGTADPPIAVTKDGTLVVAVPFEGVAVSHDAGCSWSRAPAPLADQLAVDVTLEPDDPSSLLVLTSTNDPSADPDAGFQFDTRVVETHDDARTWSEVGTPLPRDFIAATIEVAPSDRQRLYVGGVAGYPSLPVLETSLDRGLTWTRTTLPEAVPMAGAYVSAVDPRDPDRLWVRLHGALDPFGMAPTTLVTSGDRGASWTTVAATTGSMFGFALSPDGTQLAYGTQQDGVFVAPTDGSGAFERASELKDRCLTWSREGLYACGTEPIDPFSVGRSVDVGRTFVALYHFADTCPQSCADDSSFGRACRASWTDPSTGVAAITGATGEACTVPWAKISMPDAGADAASSDAAARDAGGEASSGPTLVAGGGCQCRAAGRASGGPFALVALAIAALLRRSLVRAVRNGVASRR